MTALLWRAVPVVAVLLLCSGSPYLAANPCPLNSLGLPQDAAACQRPPILRSPEDTSSSRSSTTVGTSAAPTAAATAAAAKKLTSDAFDDWLRGNGVASAKTELRTAYGSRGLFATEDMAGGEAIIEVPSHLMVTASMGKATVPGQAMLAADSRSGKTTPDRVFITLFLIWEQQRPQRDSFYQPFFDSLPSSVSHMPTMWGQDQRAWLHGSSVLQMVDLNLRIFDEYYRSIVDAYPPFAAAVPMAEFVRVYETVRSRTFRVQLLDGSTTSAMVPYADMLNHAHPPSGPMTDWGYDSKRGVFCVSAAHDIPAGSQIMLSYGWHNKLHTLDVYGLVPMDDFDHKDAGNTVFMRISLDLDDPLAAAKHDFIDAGGHRDMLVSTQLYGPWFRGEIDEVLSRLRFATARGADWESLVARSDGRTHSADWYEGHRVAVIPLLSMEGEVAALGRLAMLTQAYLTYYPKSLDQDQTRLDAVDGPAEYSDERNALLVTHGEKQLLHTYLDMARTGLACLAANTYEQAHALSYGQDNCVRQYCLEVVGQLKGWNSAGAAPAG